MNRAGKEKLELLRADYNLIRGRPFDHFFCPLLYRDDDVELSRAHIINAAFPGSARKWTIQRTDVDGFFGSMFEADFLTLQYRDKKNLLDSLGNAALGRLLRPRIFFKGDELEYYAPTKILPAAHSRIVVEQEGKRPVPLVIKLAPAQLLSGIDTDLDIRIEKDIRLPALVSLLKAAHLTMFDMLGYRYALSSGGHFLGHDILGAFYQANRQHDKTVVLSAANIHFREFVNLVRPILSAPPAFNGTATDKCLFVCTGSPKPWAFMALIKTGEHMHGVLVPILEDAEGAARFASMLKSSTPRFEVRLARYEGSRWEMETNSRMIEWPAANFE